MIMTKCFLLDRGVQMSGYFDHQTGQFVYVDDMEPEIVVPDLTDFKVNLRCSMRCFSLMNYSLVKTLCFLRCE